MSGSSTFRDLLSIKTDAVDRPRALAAGHYIGVIKGHEFATSRRKNTPFIRFAITPTEETVDVDEGANEGMEISRREVHKDYYITPIALYRLSDMLDAVLGKQSGRSFDQRIPETRGMRVMFEITRREVVDETTGEITDVYNDVNTIIAAESAAN